MNAPDATEGVSEGVDGPLLGEMSAAASAVTEPPETNSTVASVHAPQLVANVGRRIDHLVRNIELGFRVFGYIVAIILWIFIGFAIWSAAILFGIVVMCSVMVFKLVAGLEIDAESRRFSSLMGFWPNGFSTLDKAFWHETPQQRQRDQVDDPSYFFASIKILYTVFISFCIYCTWYRINPAEYAVAVRGDIWISVSVFIALTLGVAWYSDFRRKKAISTSPSGGDDLSAKL